MLTRKLKDMMPERFWDLFRSYYSKKLDGLLLEYEDLKESYAGMIYQSNVIGLGGGWGSIRFWNNRMKTEAALNNVLSEIKYYSGKLKIPVTVRDRGNIASAAMDRATKDYLNEPEYFNGRAKVAVMHAKLELL